MSLEYDNYLIRHIGAVQEAFSWIQGNLPELVPLEVNTEHISRHDESKRSIEEYAAYDNYFYGDEKDELTEELFDAAWLHHIHNNPHHWQYWVLIKDDPSPNLKNNMTPIRIPYKYILEMVCDWWSFSWVKGDLREVFKWYDKHKGTIVIHPDSKERVEYILKKIKEKLDKLDVLEGKENE